VHFNWRLRLWHTCTCWLGDLLRSLTREREYTVSLPYWAIKSSFITTAKGWIEAGFNSNYMYICKKLITGSRFSVWLKVLVHEISHQFDTSNIERLTHFTVSQLVNYLFHLFIGLIKSVCEVNNSKRTINSVLQQMSPFIYPCLIGT